ARWLVRRDSAEQQLDDELRAYVELAAAEQIRHGVSPAEARRRAGLELGGIEQTKERVRAYRHGALLDEIWRDVRYALGMMRKSPGFAAIALFTLAIGIGANTAIFSVVDHLFFRPFPFQQADRLAVVHEILRMGGGPTRATPVSLAHFR